MGKKLILFSALFLMLFSLVPANQEKTKVQAKQENPISLATNSMLDLLAKNFQVKKIVGDPLKVGNVTIIPLIMIDVGYGGGGASANPQMQLGSGFYMSGEAKPLGFIIISKSGTKFLSAGKAPRE